MAYVISEPCSGAKDTSCVEVCPVDCIHPTPDEPGFDAADQLYIDPDECIDCDACVEACPVDAIAPEDMVPPARVQLGTAVGLRRRPGRPPAGTIPGTRADGRTRRLTAPSDQKRARRRCRSHFCNSRKDGMYLGPLRSARETRAWWQCRSCSGDPEGRS